MKPVKPGLSQIGAKGGALAMLSALAAYAVSDIRSRCWSFRC